MVGRGVRLDAAVLLLLVGVTLWRLLPAVETTPFHRDEARWIANAALLGEWRDPLGPRWQDEGYRSRYRTLDERTRRRNQAPLMMYVLGASLVVQGEGLPRNGYWIMGRDTEWNAARGNMPSAAQLRAGRLTNVAIAALTVACVYLLGARLTNRVGGAAGALLFAVHPLVRLTSTQAWADPLFVLLIAVAGLVAARLATATWPRAVALGVLLGLGTATKLSSLPVAVAIGGIGLLLWGGSALRGGRSSPTLRRLGPRLAAVPLVAAATFVAVYPYLWRDPVGNTRRMFAFRALSFDIQAKGSPAAVPDRADAVRRIGHELGDRFSAGGLLAEQAERLTGRPAWPSIDYLDLCVAAVGLLLLVALVARDGPSSPPALASMVVAGHAVVIVLAMRVEYARYLHPVLLLVALGAGVAAGEGWTWSRGVWQRRFHGGLVGPRDYVRDVQDGSVERSWGGPRCRCGGQRGWRTASPGAEPPG